MALATKISVASAFTRLSLERLAPAVPIVVTPYGFPVDQIAPRARLPSGRFTVVAVGTHDLTEGHALSARGLEASRHSRRRLHLIGPLTTCRSPSWTPTQGCFDTPLMSPKATYGPTTRPPTCWHFQPSGMDSASSFKKPCAPAHRWSRPRAEAGPSASPTVSTAGWFPPETSTPWWTDFEPVRPIGTERTVWGWRRAVGRNDGRGMTPVPRWYARSSRRLCVSFT